TTIRVEVVSISFFTRASGVGDLAQVRYIKRKRSAAGGTEERSYWIASVQYAYGEPSKQPAMRRWNPLGFKVVEFQAQQEVHAAPQPTSARSEPTGAERSE